MHTLFLLSALVLATALGGLGACLLRLAPVGTRRPIAMVALAVPSFVLALAATHLVPRFWPDCAPLTGWDWVASVALLTVLGSVAVGALVLNVARLVLIERLLLVCPVLTDSSVVAHVRMLAGRLGMRKPPCLRLLQSGAPLALSGGVRQSTIVLSSWLIERLDADELEAVLTHELAHLARKDDQTRWVSRLLRDATVYLPSSWYALRVLESDEEIGADALAANITNRPLAIASALGKVWRGALGGAEPVSVAGLPGYAGASAELLEERLTRLLDGRARGRSTLPGRLLAGLSVVSVSELTPRLLAISANALPLICTMRPY